MASGIISTGKSKHIMSSRLDFITKRICRSTPALDLCFARLFRKTEQLRWTRKNLFLRYNSDGASNMGGLESRPAATWSKSCCSDNTLTLACEMLDLRSSNLNLAFIAPRPVWLESIPYGSFFTLLSRSPGPGPIANRHQFRPDSTSFMATRRSLLILRYHILQVILIRILDRYISICVSLIWNRLGYLSWRAIPGFHIRPWFCLLLVSTLDWQCQHAAVTDPPVACQQRRESALSGKRLPRCWYRQLVRWLCSLTDQQTEQLQHWLLPGNNKTASHWCCTMSYTCNVCEITACQARQANDVMLIKVHAQLLLAKLNLPSSNLPCCTQVHIAASLHQDVLQSTQIPAQTVKLPAHVTGQHEPFHKIRRSQVSLCPLQNVTVLPGWYDLDDVMHAHSVLLSM